MLYEARCSKLYSVPLKALSPFNALFSSDTRVLHTIRLNVGCPSCSSGAEDSKAEISAAEAALEAKLQVRITAVGFEASPTPLRAECNQTLWSHIDTRHSKAKLEMEVIYRIRWKLCWTPKSKIDDAKSKCMKRRQSARVRDTAPERAAKIDTMMIVACLEQWL